MITNNFILNSCNSLAIESINAALLQCELPTHFIKKHANFLLFGVGLELGLGQPQNGGTKINNVNLEKCVENVKHKLKSKK